MWVPCSLHAKANCLPLNVGRWQHHLSKDSHYVGQFCGCRWVGRSSLPSVKIVMETSSIRRVSSRLWAVAPRTVAG